LRVISDIEKGTVLVDGVESGSIRIGYATVMLPSGNYDVTVKKLSSDAEWLFKAKKVVEVGSDGITVAELTTIKTATKKRKDRLAKAEKELKEAKRRIAELREKQRLAQWNSKSFFADPKTKLIWMNISLVEQEISVARAYCKNMEFAGSKEWRLPSMIELSSLSLTKLNVDKKFLSSDIDKSKSSLRPRLLNTKNTLDSITYSSRKHVFRCVRDSDDRVEKRNEIASKFKFETYPKNIFLDEKNMLLWENAEWLGENWSRAIRANGKCNKLNLGGRHATNKPEISNSWGFIPWLLCFCVSV